MSQKITHSTQDVSQRFPAHGIVEAQVDGRVVRHVAIGPFNDELLVAFTTIHEPIAQEMASSGRWLDFYVLQQSALTTPQTIAGYAQYLKHLSQCGLAPAATVFILPRDVEGATVMRPLYEKLFADAGLRFAAFDERADAEVWLQTELKNL
ncbi:MAG: hypothetical protein ABI411_12510 [Tahibacter sp.]